MLFSPQTGRYALTPATQLGAFLVLLIALFVGGTAVASSPIGLPTESRPTSVDCSIPVSAYAERERNSACTNETIALFADVDRPIPSSQPSSAKARKASLVITYTWLAPPGASLNTYTGDEVIASFTTSGLKAFTVIASDGECSGSDIVEITAELAPDITIFFPNSLSIVPISDAQPTVTQITLPNIIRATQGVLYEWHVVIDRINGYEIRQGETNGTGIFQVGHVGPYVLTVTGLNGCKRTVRGTLILAPGGGGN